MTEQVYLDLLKQILAGKERKDRTGVGTIGIFGTQSRYNIRDSFPLLTTKQIHFKSVVNELLWFLSGSTDNNDLKKRGVTIWNEWATTEQCARFGRQEGDLGPVYGHQWRAFGGDYEKTQQVAKHPETTNLISTIAGVPGEDYNPGIDQISWVINEIKRNPFSRRLIVTGWNPAEQDKVALPPCHTLFQFYVQNDELSCQLYQRSADTFLGVPFNVASYSLLTYMVAHVCGLKPGEFVHTIGDAHIYSNHLEQVQLQLSRVPYSAPTVKINRQVKDIFDFKFEDFELVGYQAHPRIKAPIAV